jgi:hypothetical protein
MLGPVSILSGSAQQPDLLGSDGQIRLLPSSAYDSFGIYILDSHEGVM